MNVIKLVVVGDSAVGKTSLFISYAKKEFPIEYIPTVADSYSETVLVGQETYAMGLWDTTCHDGYDHLRPLSYPQTDIFLICFNVASPTSFENVREKWVPELHHHRPRTPFLIVATQVDQRYDLETLEKTGRLRHRPVMTEQGERLTREMGAAKYLECSAKTGLGVKNVFDHAAAVAVNSPEFQNRWKKSCIVL
ncbi:P-loop containing nucleoside triphosphate hydrolase protein [Mycena alexandri]|uniref:P-loop containing nucleoside triphosphate hydrolase protein n=1 Tax=Mycena alexandri TaxID=1745969 RepID=A0AAD6WYL5_9AGAR|nr:P-loop containing nucleoside triphosphate hydrolase protein [Mycena alexandri]